MKKVAFIGCGNMGEAILKGILDKGLMKKSSVMVSDISSTRRGYVRNVYGVSVTDSNIDIIKKADVVILCIKPQDIKKVIEEIGFDLKDKLVVSIAAGVTIDFLKANAKRVVRVMPNTPALVGCGISAIAIGKGLPKADEELVDQIFLCVGDVLHIKEEFMDIVTAVSGSGPAYYFLLMEAMVETAVSCGLKKEDAEKLVYKTAFGAAMLKNKLKIDPSVLRNAVTSKGGTTEAALKVFDKGKFNSLVKNAIRSAAKRSKQLRIKE